MRVIYEERVVQRKCRKNVLIEEFCTWYQQKKEFCKENADTIYRNLLIKFFIVQHLAKKVLQRICRPDVFFAFSVYFVCFFIHIKRNILFPNSFPLKKSLTLFNSSVSCHYLKYNKKTSKKKQDSRLFFLIGTKIKKTVTGSLYFSYRK